jgi:hypothetical protein
MKSLPEVNQDPLILQGRQAQLDFDRKVNEIRKDPMLSEVAKAEQIDAAWTDYRTTIETAQTKFYAQRQARLEQLEALVPIGPNIPADASRADAAVLHQAFSVAYTAAIEAPTEELGPRYAQAVRFGDDLTARAILTASADRGTDRGTRAVLDQWAAEDPTRGPALQETLRLRELMAGRGTDSRFAAQAFGRLLVRSQPPESANLANIRSRAGL